MLIVDGFEVRRWSPDFSSSGQDSPVWHAVSFSGYELTNAVLDVDWDQNPTQLILCECCGVTGCNSGGWAHLSRIGQNVLLTEPNIDETNEVELGQSGPSDAIINFGSLLVASRTWDDLRSQFLSIPAWAQIPATTRSDLARAWLMSAIGRRRMPSLGDAKRMLDDSLLATDELSRKEALECLSRIVSWFEDSPDDEVKGYIESASEKTRIERLYFDGPPEEDWPALAIVDGAPVPAFSNSVYFFPEEGSLAPSEV
ncbi:MAG: hypothetical protein GY906_27240 [bacterium]|nr:hypothetical protein [bacterium]